MVDTEIIENTLKDMEYYLSTYNNIYVGVSGGSDSNIIVHMIATKFSQYIPKIHFVFSNTGLEYNATLKHLIYMEKTYGIHIDRIKGESIVTVARREGFPILSKVFSHTIPQAMRGAPSAWRKINGEYEYNGGRSRFDFTPKQRELARYLIDNGIKVSDKCCNLSKKNPGKKYIKLNKCDLQISGERKAEGGARSFRYTNCFVENSKEPPKYMPLFFWDDETKEHYKNSEKIRYSDCYEVWGMLRTGCAGCPFSSGVGDELKLLRQYDPQLYKACLNVFGESYILLDKFNIRRHPIIDEGLPELLDMYNSYESQHNKFTEIESRTAEHREGDKSEI